MKPSEGKGRAPGPRGHLLFGHLHPFRKDPLSFLLESARRYGDIVRFRLGPSVVHLINHPDPMEQVLQKRAVNYDKATRSAKFIRTVCGDSLLSSNGSAWQQQRRMLQPFFHQHKVRGFAELMIARTETFLQAWRKRQHAAEPLDLAAEMMRLTYSIAANAFFQAGTEDEAQTIARALETILPHTFGRVERIVSPPLWVPTAANRRFHSALGRLDEVVCRLIHTERQRAQDGSPPGNMLGMLLSVRDEATGLPLTDRQIRDHTLTFLLAGHETTSNALTWTFYLLASHPEVQASLRQVVQATLNGNPPRLEDLPKLQEVRHVLREAMRLYPPIWIIERHVLHDDQVGGIWLPAGSSVLVCPYTLHRHPEFWDEPDAFRPDRFARDVPPAYLPFGTGPRSCIGAEFALLEAQLITSRVVQAFRLELAPGAQVVPLPGITLRTRFGLPILLHPC